MIALSVALAAAVFGAPPVTTIQDTLYKADSTPFEGILIINWKTFEGPDSSNIPTNSLTAQVVGGNLYVKLVPTTTAPTAAYYSVRYVADGDVQFTEFWSVPESATALRVPDVRVDWPPTTAAVGEGTEIPMADVTGLIDALNIRPTKGITYVPSRAAVIGATGELEAAAGTLGDCIHVDGSTGPCGPGVSYVDGETPTGAIDGINTSFTLAGTPNPAASIKLSRNGMLQSQGVDFTIAGNSITFLAGAIPQPGDGLRASYRFEHATGASAAIFVDAETPTGTMDGVNTSFTLSVAPNPAGSLQLHRNGLLLEPGTHFTLSGASLTMLAGSIPEAGDEFVAFYRIDGV
ncbi:MAG: hypothetical protein GY953_34155 [bacterium]|nr:hypothetical protein [bacterium]